MCAYVPQCRFIHTLDDTADGTAAAAEPLGGVRRPVLHIVVLFASDTRVLSYARAVAQKFMDHGVDVFVQRELTEMGLGVSGASGPQYIKPEHLSTLISASGGDDLIVIGDRNMRNDTCQVRRA